MINYFEKSFLIELNKIAQESTPFQDFLAGVEPTGVKTFEYGLKNIKSPSRHLIPAVTGGFLGGAMVVPGAISGALRAGAALVSKKPKLFFKSFGQGFISPYRSLARGIRTQKYIGGLEKQLKAGKKVFIPKERIKEITRAMEEVPLGGLKQLSPKQFSVKSVGKMPIMQEGKGITLSSEHLDTLSKLRGRVRGTVAKGSAGIGTAGFLNALSAYLQYGSGIKTKRSYGEIPRKI